MNPLFVHLFGKCDLRRFNERTGMELYHTRFICGQSCKWWSVSDFRCYISHLHNIPCFTDGMPSTSSVGVSTAFYRTVNQILPLYNNLETSSNARSGGNNSVGAQMNCLSSLSVVITDLPPGTLLNPPISLLFTHQQVGLHC